MFKINSNLFHPERSLFSLPVVQWTFLVFLCIAIALAATIAIIDPAPFSMTSAGLNNAAEYFKIPLAILAIGLTFIGIYGANHRSEQTKKQIERALTQIELSNSQMKITKEQNNFSNFYKHIEEFDKYCNSISTEKLKITQTRQLHRIIFPKANAISGNYEVSADFISDLEKLVNLFLDLSNGFNDENKEKRIGAAFYIQKNVRKFNEKHYFKMSNAGIPGKSHLYGLETFTIHDGGIKKIATDFIYLVSKSDEIISFDLNYSPSRKIKDLSEVDLSLVTQDAELKNPFDLNKLLIK
ncbi:hypothetical protein GCN78_11385 [Janthinobacterium rivuli]|uniref:hypothetical protein n=1 Tax=Janthinobacterium sp. FT68W TaxID=2654255 RepID=UPI001264B45A|nr:hypothetical protein [Janthinobacterium sp. FT68W]KAB8051620.1 hypothetical protein GCN78_11385 [Janthinobacterium sp. FT68W]